MSARINGVDCLTLHQVSLLCAASVAAGNTTDELGAVFLDEPVDLAVLKGELLAIQEAGQPAETQQAVTLALDAIGA